CTSTRRLEAAPWPWRRSSPFRSSSASPASSAWACIPSRSSWPRSARRRACSDVVHEAMREPGPAPRDAQLSSDPPPDLIAIVRQKLAAGELPRGEEAGLTLNLGPIRPCDACDLPITGMEHIAELPDGRKFRFHALCIEAWRRERG